MSKLNFQHHNCSLHHTVLQKSIEYVDLLLKKLLLLSMLKTSVLIYIVVEAMIHYSSGYFAK